MSQGMLYPHLIGNDVGCGMGLWLSDLSRKKLKLDRWEKKLVDLDQPWNGDRQGWLAQFQIGTCEQDQALGTIGGGNHFAELQQVQEIRDAECFKSLGMDADRLVVLVHSGSRGLGKAVLWTHQEKHSYGGLMDDSDDSGGRDPKAFDHLQAAEETMTRQWLQITSGRGPAECAWAVSHVLRCIVEEAAKVGVKTEVLEAVPGPFSGTLRSVLLRMDGTGVPKLTKGWVGSVLWINRSPFRPEYKRKNWFVGIEEIAVPEHPRWSEKEIKIETMRASGPGGQHVNKTESAVRVTHLPTGLSVSAREERSQHANRRLALARLAERLNERGKVGERGMQKERWNQHAALERGNPIRIYEGPQFDLRRRT